MSKGSKRRRAEAEAAQAKSKAEKRDPITRLSRFGEFLALGMLAAAFFLPFGNDLNHPNSPPVGWEHIPALGQKLAFVAVHTRTPWVALTLVGMTVAVWGYYLRRSPKRRRVVMAGLVAGILVMAAHAGAQGYLQSQGPLRIEIRGPVTIHDTPGRVGETSVSIDPAPRQSVQVIGVTRITYAEGTMEQWRMLVAGDLLFAAPLVLTWLLGFVIAVVNRQAGKEKGTGLSQTQT